MGVTHIEVDAPAAKTETKNKIDFNKRLTMTSEVHLRGEEILTEIISLDPAVKESEWAVKLPHKANRNRITLLITWS